MALLFCSVLLLHSALFLLFVSPVCTNEWEGKGQNRGNKESCGIRDIVWEQRTEVFCCQNEEGKYHGIASL